MARTMNELIKQIKQIIPPSSSVTICARVSQPFRSV